MMTKVYVCDGVPFLTVESARNFAKTYFDATGELPAIEIDEAAPESVPDRYGVVQYHRPNPITRHLRRAARKTALYIQETRSCLRREL